MIVAPSILAANFNQLDDEIKRVNETTAEFLHLDVMDGNFVPSHTFDNQLIEKLRPQSSKVFDVHLMITNPADVYQTYYQAGADYLTFHYEAIQDPMTLIKKMKQHGKVGISIKPGTDVSVLAEYLPYLDLVLVMSVEPGKGGQSFMPSSLTKIAYLAKEKMTHGYHYLIEVDGGINHETSKLVKASGADAVVAGTYLFNSDDMKKAVKELQSI